jgi:ABC-type dipeptide/oligopeptide/nickel transport system ATPase component
MKSILKKNNEDNNNEVFDFYKLVDTKDEQKLTRDYKNHYIKPCSLCLLLGETGQGKTTIFLDFIKRAEERFYQIHIYTSNPDEPLYKMMKEKIPEIVFYTNIKDIPKLDTFDDQYEKLILFDDFIKCPKKERDVIEDWIIKCRKRKFTVFCMAQIYKDVSKLIVRNMNYIFILRMNDMTPLNYIHKNYASEIPKE